MGVVGVRHRGALEIRNHVKLELEMEVDRTTNHPVCRGETQRPVVALELTVLRLVTREAGRDQNTNPNTWFNRQLQVLPEIEFASLKFHFENDRASPVRRQLIRLTVIVNPINCDEPLSKKDLEHR